MSRFDNFANVTFQHEAGYVDNPKDKGGPTNFGITQKVARAHGYMGLMQALPKSFANDIYGKDYWNNLYDLISDIRLAFKLFDLGVNCGVNRAVKNLQQAISMIRNEFALNGDSNCGNIIYITVDGIFGKDTLTAVNQCPANILYKKYCKVQEDFYRNLVDKDKTQKIFLNDWLNRLNKVYAD